VAIIAENPRSYVLFEDGKGWILTVVGGAGGQRDVSLRLSEAERASVRADRGFIRQLATDVAANPARFAHRKLEAPVWPRPGER
jgi:hypothetical protein